ncbi:MAG: hypothetical protein ABI680_07240, partial [Chthoniobacteraceae bacterium]
MKHIALLLGLLTTAAALGANLDYAIAPGAFEDNPGGAQLGPCHGAAVIDKAGNIYVTTDTERGIIVFSPAGKYVRHFGPDKIHGAEIREEDGTEYIYAARAGAHEVVKLTLDGTELWKITGTPETGYEDPNGFNPCAVTVGPEGEIFIAD